MDALESLHDQPEKNEQIVRDYYDALLKQDVPACLALLADDVEMLFYGPAEIPFSGHFLGHSEVTGFLYRLMEVAEPVEFEPQEFSASATRVLVYGHEKIRAKPTGRIWQSAWSHVFQVRNGLIIRMREQHDVAAIVDAYRDIEPQL